MANEQQSENISLPTEVWVVASNRRDGDLPDPRKILGMGYPQGPKDKKWGESVFFSVKEDAEAFLASIDEHMRQYFGVFKAWIEIKAKA